MLIYCKLCYISIDLQRLSKGLPMSRTSNETISSIAAVGAAFCLVIAILAVPLGVIWGATHGGLTREGVVAGLVAWAICEAGGLFGFGVLGGTSAIAVARGHHRR